MDSRENIYLGTLRGIAVYADSTQIALLYSPPSRAYAFTIKDDRLIVSNMSTVYAFDTDGNIISTREDVYSEAFYRMENRNELYNADNGRQYVIRGGVITPLKVIRDDGVVVYKGSVLAGIINFAFRFIALIFAVCIVTIVVWSRNKLKNDFRILIYQ